MYIITPLLRLTKTHASNNNFSVKRWPSAPLT
jgi:hypothetical protein